MLSANIRLSMVATLKKINDATTSIRCALELPELPDEANIAAISHGVEQLLADLIALKAEKGRSETNVQNGHCEFFSVQYEMCMQPCGKCTTPDRLDCGARWKDGHPVHLGKCSYII